MKTRIVLAASALSLALSVASASAAGGKTPVTAEGIASLVRVEVAPQVTVTVFATGLYNPRGLTFGNISRARLSRTMVSSRTLSIRRRPARACNGVMSLSHQLDSVGVSTFTGMIVRRNPR